jgi:hypothetical protein
VLEKTFSDLENIISQPFSHLEICCRLFMSFPFNFLGILTHRIGHINHYILMQFSADFFCVKSKKILNIVLTFATFPASFCLLGFAG